jgi:hypothetical protein
MNYTLVSKLLFSFSFFMTISAAQKEPKTFTPWTAEQFRTADAEALRKRSEELAEIFGLSKLRGNPANPEIELQKMIFTTIEKPENIEIIDIMLSGNNKAK